MAGVGARHAELAQGHQQLAVQVVFAHHIARLAAFGQAVGNPDIVLGVDIDAVRIDDGAVTEAFHQLSVRSEFQDRVFVGMRHAAIIGAFATVEDPDAFAVAVDVDARDAAPFAPRRQLRPAHDFLVTKIGKGVVIRVRCRHGGRRRGGPV